VLKESIFFRDIEKVDSWDTIATRNLNVYVRDREGLFTANLRNRSNLSRSLVFLEDCGVPLSNLAQACLAENFTRWKTGLVAGLVNPGTAKVCQPGS
jgi:hypothetical protein